MSVDRSCECGAIIPAYVLGCKACGRNFKAQDERLVEQEIPAEPPIGLQAPQDEDREIQRNYNSSSYDLPSQIQKEKSHRFTFSSKSDRGNKKSLRDIASFLVFLLFMIVVIFSASPGAFKDSIFQRFGFQSSFSLDFQEDDNGFKFIEYADNGVPAYFKGCGPIDYFVRQNYASSEDLSLIGEAMSEVSRGFGRSFKFQGFTENRDVSKLPEGVLIDFTSSSEFQEELRISTSPHVDAAGLGGPDEYENTSKPRFGSLVSARGTVWINEDYWSSMESRYKVHVLTHELGHVLGLTHPTNGEGQLMGDLNESYELSSLGSGDLMGLQILSALAGCREFPDYLTPVSTQSSATEENTGSSNESDVYTGGVNALGQARLDRSLISTSSNSCGNEFPEVVQDLNEKISATWQMFEDDGCGSGRSYTWADPGDKSEFVLLQFSASVGWCQDIYPDDLDKIKYRFAADANSFEKVNSNSGRNAYVYTRTSVDPSKDIYGVIEVGNEYNWCGDGQTLMEFGENLQSNDELFSEVLTLVFGEF